MEDIVINNTVTTELRDNVIEYITLNILHDESIYYDLLLRLEEDKSMLNSDSFNMCNLIKTTTEIHYNNLYNSIKGEVESSSKNIIIDLAGKHNISPYALLNILFKVKFYCHISINRLALCTSDKDNFEQTLVNQINMYMQNNSILHYFDLNCDENITQEKAFVIETKCE